MNLVKTSSFNLQPELKNDIINLVPLKEQDFEDLYTVASDPLIWEQHPNKNRYQKDVFKTFLEGAIKSGGAFKIYDVLATNLFVRTRFYLL